MKRPGMHCIFIKQRALQNLCLLGPPFKSAPGLPWLPKDHCSNDITTLRRKLPWAPQLKGQTHLSSFVCRSSGDRTIRESCFDECDSLGIPHSPLPFCFAGFFHAIPDKARICSGVCGFLPLSGTPDTISGSFPSLLCAEGFVSRLKENSNRRPWWHSIVTDDRRSTCEGSKCFISFVTPSLMRASLLFRWLSVKREENGPLLYFKRSILNVYCPGFWLNCQYIINHILPFGVWWWGQEESQYNRGSRMLFCKLGIIGIESASLHLLAYIHSMSSDAFVRTKHVLCFILSW